MSYSFLYNCSDTVKTTMYAYSKILPFTDLILNFKLTNIVDPTLNTPTRAYCAFILELVKWLVAVVT